MVGVGLILVLVGFAMLASSRGVPGSAARQNVWLATQRFSAGGNQGAKSKRYQVIQIIMGVVVLAGGIAMIWFSG